MKKENILMWFGSIIAVITVFVPFAIIYFTKAPYTVDSFGKLGTIGDFFGGTTVGLLSLASISFVTAAIIMQKEELRLQRAELKATTAEYKITNATMRKQQFDSTFFNMINLHHNILKEITYQEGTGRDAIALLFKRVNEEYKSGVLNSYELELKELILVSSKTTVVNDFLLKSFIFNKKQDYIHEIRKKAENGRIRDFDFISKQYVIKNVETKINDIKNDIDGRWLEIKEKEKKDFDSLQENKSFLNKILREANFEELMKASVQNDFIQTYTQDTLLSPLNYLKIKAYETVYNENENSIGHYYRNLYRIIKLIQDEKFVEDVVNNEIEKKKYRGILRAQLSSFELMMLFYNVVYSQKGEKFRSYLMNTNFFDDHLVQSDFIWANDKEELKVINAIQ
ncbi:hypothetical protein C161_11033 [Paenibacillus sp. FSL R5-192]|uniref:putative phage abortive infection protein n=1 Tax=unclassified Paenibacillus TaxID=185978 RepID=UPI0003E29AFE|nr:putative phage abortive infection protein [Paenibacillus sp. FSL R5-192]ETT37038.1 hypothetical protein C161_11033 [Paenibacillus sp. FSL R5-192]